MGRIPIYTSRAPMRRAPVVMPPVGTGTQVAASVGAFARTVGKVAEDWATKKAQVEAESEYANNTVLYKQAINNNIKVQSEDASIDPDDLVTNYRKSMQEVSGSLVWKSKLAQKQFQLNKGNFDLGAEQRLNVLGRQRFITNLNASWKTARKIAVDERDLNSGLLSLQAIQSAFTPAQYKAAKIDLIHDIAYGQAQDATALDLRADLSGKEFESLSVKEKAKIKKEARAEKYNEQLIINRETKEKQLKNGNELYVRATEEVIPVKELNAMLLSEDISLPVYKTMLKAHHSNPKTNLSVWTKYFNETEKPTGKYKDPIELQNAIIQSQMIDGDLTVADGKELLKKVVTPQSKSKINDFAVAKKYLESELSVDDAERLTYLLDEEIRENPDLTGEAILDRAKKMTDQVKSKDIKITWGWFIDDATREKKVEAWEEKRLEKREVKKRETRKAVTKKKTFNAEGTGYDTETAAEAGLESKEGHLPSLDPRTGMVLKARKHPTWDLMVDEETKLGNKIVKKADRYYSVPKTEKTKRISAEARSKAKAKAGKVRVVAPDGKEYWLPEAELEEAKKAGYKAVE